MKLWTETRKLKNVFLGKFLPQRLREYNNDIDELIWEINDRWKTVYISLPFEVFVILHQLFGLLA